MFQKYGAALISILLVVAVFLKTAFAGGIDLAEDAQLAVLVAGAIVTFLLPLVKGPWAGVLKVGTAVVTAAGTAILPFILQATITPEQWTTVAIAVLGALGVQIGVSARTSGLIDGGTAVPGTAAVITSLPDPEGARALGVE